MKLVKNIKVFLKKKNKKKWVKNLPEYEKKLLEYRKKYKMRNNTLLL